jgi:hypothetical protein
MQVRDDALGEVMAPAQADLAAVRQAPAAIGAVVVVVRQ